MKDLCSCRYYPDPGDRLGLSMPHVQCRTCGRLYMCETDLEIHALECSLCGILRRMPLAFLAYGLGSY